MAVGCLLSDVWLNPTFIVIQSLHFASEVGSYLKLLYGKSTVNDKAVLAVAFLQVEDYRKPVKFYRCRSDPANTSHGKNRKNAALGVQHVLSCAVVLY